MQAVLAVVPLLRPGLVLLLLLLLPQLSLLLYSLLVARPLPPQPP